MSDTEYARVVQELKDAKASQRGDPAARFNASQHVFFVGHLAYVAAGRRMDAATKTTLDRAERLMQRIRGLSLRQMSDELADTAEDWFTRLKAGGAAPGTHDKALAEVEAIVARLEQR